MNPQLLLSIKRIKKVQNCEIMLPHRQSRDEIYFPKKGEILIFIKSENDLRKLRTVTRKLGKITQHCFLERKKYRAQELINPNNIFHHGSRQYIRMFHGTNLKHIISILQDGLQLVGGGLLGEGFYMTPSLEKSEQYILKQGQKKNNPIVLELFLPITTTVSAYNYHLPNSNLYTEKDSFWQYICKDEQFLKSIVYNIWMYESTL